MAKSGFSVTLIDMDSGGANLYFLRYHFQSRYAMTDFVEGRVDSLELIIEALDRFRQVRVITRTGDSLYTANMPATTRRKILRHIHQNKSEVVITDVGVGTHFNTLDFFNAANLHVCVTTGDPTAILDLAGYALCFRPTLEYQTWNGWKKYPMILNCEDR